MNQHLTPLEAWADFYKYIKSGENWKGVSRELRDQIAKAQRAALAGTLGNSRIKSLVTQCAPGRYEIVESAVFYLNE